MEDKRMNDIKKWLEYIMPSAVETLVANLTGKDLSILRENRGISKFVCADMNDYHTPITAISFCVWAENKGVRLTASPIIADAEEHYIPGTESGMLLDYSTFATDIINDEHIQLLVNSVTELYKGAVEDLN